MTTAHQIPRQKLRTQLFPNVALTRVCLQVANGRHGFLLSPLAARMGNRQWNIGGRKARHLELLPQLVLKKGGLGSLFLRFGSQGF